MAPEKTPGTAFDSNAGSVCTTALRPDAFPVRADAGLFSGSAITVQALYTLMAAEIAMSLMGRPETRGSAQEWLKLSKEAADKLTLMTGKIH